MFLSKAEVRPLSGTCQNQPFVSLSGLIGMAPQTSRSVVSISSLKASREPRIHAAATSQARTCRDAPDVACDAVSGRAILGHRHPNIVMRATAG
jgi:hypothetical protein